MRFEAAVSSATFELITFNYSSYYKLYTYKYSHRDNIKCLEIKVEIGRKENMKEKKGKINKKI